MKKNIIIFLIFYAIFNCGCSKKSELPAPISFLIGQAFSGKNFQSMKKAQVKENVADLWVKTGEKSVCEVNLSHHVIKMNASTQFYFGLINLGNTVLEMQEGYISVKGVGQVKSPFVIRTPAINVSVRGTEFSLWVKKDSKGFSVTKLMVKSGSVAVSRNLGKAESKEIFINANEKCQASEEENTLILKQDKEINANSVIKVEKASRPEINEINSVEYSTEGFKAIQIKSPKYEKVKNRGRDDLEDSLRK